MAHARISPVEVHSPGYRYSHIAISSRDCMVFFAGQAAIGPDGNVVGEGDLRTQVMAAMENLRVLMDAVNATWSDVVRRTVYATEFGEPGLIGEMIAGFTGETVGPPQSLVRVAGLARPGLMVEIEVTAMIQISE